MLAIGPGQASFMMPSVEGRAGAVAGLRKLPLDWGGQVTSTRAGDQARTGQGGTAAAACQRRISWPGGLATITRTSVHDMTVS